MRIFAEKKKRFFHRSSIDGDLDRSAPQWIVRADTCSLVSSYIALSQSCVKKNSGKRQKYT